jgi:hypothetical protein
VDAAADDGRVAVATGVVALERCDVDFAQLAAELRALTAIVTLELEYTDGTHELLPIQHGYVRTARRQAAEPADRPQPRRRDHQRARR